MVDRQKSFCERRKNLRRWKPAIIRICEIISASLGRDWSRKLILWMPLSACLLKFPDIHDYDTWHSAHTPTTVGRSNSSVEGFISAKYFPAIPFILQIFRASWGASDIWVMEAFLLLFLRDALMMSFREICWMQIFSNFLFLR